MIKEILKTWINNQNNQNTFRSLYDWKLIPLQAEYCISVLTRGNDFEADIKALKKTLQAITNRRVEIYSHSRQSNHLVMIVTEDKI